MLDPKILDRVRAVPPDDRIKLLRNAYAGETAFLVACGPSTGQYDPEYLRERLHDRLVITVKHAADLFPGLTDIHLVNAVNVKAYQYGEPRPLVILSCAAEQLEQMVPRFRPDIMFQRPGRGEVEVYVSRTQNFDDWLIEKSPRRRPLGPTITFHVGMYLAVHLGVARVVTLGVDMAPDDIRHYYNLQERKDCGVTAHSNWEAGLVRQAADAWVRWLNTHGVQWLRAWSDYPHGFPTVPTVRV